MKSDLSVNLEGMRETMRALDDMDKGQSAMILRDSIKPAMTPINRQAKANAKGHKDSGALYASLGVKTSLNRGKGTATGIVGARRGTKYHRNGNMPTRYMHLVEFGHVARDGSRVPGKFILRNALASTKDAAQTVFKRTLGDRVIKQMQRNARRRGVKI